MIGLLCRTPKKESRHELMCRVAAGGGVFKGENGVKFHIPGANLNDIANQADDLLEVLYRKLLYSFLRKYILAAYFIIVHCVLKTAHFLLLQLC